LRTDLIKGLSVLIDTQILPQVNFRSLKTADFSGLFRFKALRSRSVDLNMPAPILIGRKKTCPENGSVNGRDKKTGKKSFTCSLLIFLFF
jgi:hypothetical protein